MREAIGKHPIGKATVLDDGKFKYDLRCEDCGDLLGSVVFSTEHTDQDPADSGLVCSKCIVIRRAV